MQDEPLRLHILRSRRLTTENSEDPTGRHVVLAMIPLVKGIEAVESANTPDAVYMKCSRDLTLRTLDFELADWKGAVVNLCGRPISFELCVRPGLISRQKLNSLYYFE